jgi:hypothetical protein
MADQRILYTEKMAGAGHANPDTLNRLMLIEHDSSGMHKTAFRPSFHVTRAGDSTTIGTSGLQNLNFATKVYDVGGNWTSGATWTLTPSRSGKWLLNASINIYDTATNVPSWLSFVNGTTEIVRGPAIFVPIGAAQRSYELNAVVNISSANAYKLQFYWPGGGGPDIVGASSVTFFQGHFIGV